MKTPTLDPDIAPLDKEGTQQLNRLEKHHINLRRSAVVTAIVVMIAASILEGYILCSLDTWKELGDFIVLLAIAPILSITIIMTFILIGSFKKPDDSDVSLSSAMQIVQSLAESSN